MKRILAFIALILIAAGMVFPAAQNRRFTVMMVLWRGVNDSERGFMDYFKERSIPADFIIRDCNNETNSLPAIIAEIRAVRPDLIYTFGTTTTKAIAGPAGAASPAKHITDIPIVFNIVAKPVGAKLVTNLASSGRNLTGASHLVPTEAQFNAMRSALPCERIAVIFNPAEENSVVQVKELDAVAAPAKVTVIRVPVPLNEQKKPDPGALPALIETIAQSKVSLVYLPSDSFIIANAKNLVPQLTARGIPTFSATEEPIRKNGAFLGLVCPYYNVGKFAGYKAEQILVNGVAPANIPIETLKRFSFLVNMPSAHTLNRYPPVSILKFAEVITAGK